MHSILFSIGPFHVYGYGFMIAVGIICAFTIGCFLAKRSGLDDDALFSMGLVGIVGGIIGAKLLYYIVEFPSIIADPSILLNFGEGFVVYGGLIAGFLSPLIYTRIKKLSFLPNLDCAVPGVAFAQGCGTHRLFSCRLLLWKRDIRMVWCHISGRLSCTGRYRLFQHSCFQQQETLYLR